MVLCFSNFIFILVSMRWRIYCGWILDVKLWYAWKLSFWKLKIDPLMYPCFTLVTFSYIFFTGLRLASIVLFLFCTLFGLHVFGIGRILLTWSSFTVLHVQPATFNLPYSQGTSENEWASIAEYFLCLDFVTDTEKPRIRHHNIWCRFKTKEENMLCIPWHQEVESQMHCGAWWICLFKMDRGSS